MGAGPRIPDSNPQIHGKLASSACPALPGLLCENLRLRTSQDGEGGKAGLCSSYPLSFKVLLKYEKVSPYIFVLLFILFVMPVVSLLTLRALFTDPGSARPGLRGWKVT